MKIAIFNGFPFHHEMYGYIIHYCILKKIELTIYCHRNTDNGYIYFYNIFFTNNNIEYKDISNFESEKYNYDFIILSTDDDFNFNTNDNEINNKTICIDHYYQIRNPVFEKHIATRPFSKEYYRNWALPIYPILNTSKKQELIEKENCNIVLLGHSSMNYNVSIINRIKSDKKRIIHAISRYMSIDKLDGLDNSIEIHIYTNIETNTLIQILSTACYMITDSTVNNDYTSKGMSGSIPISFSTLTPLIISKETNSYYQFKNVVEFVKESDEPIVLHSIDIESLERERNELIDKNHALFDSMINQ